MYWKNYVRMSVLWEAVDLGGPCLVGPKRKNAYCTHTVVGGDTYVFKLAGLQIDCGV